MLHLAALVQSVVKTSNKSHIEILHDLYGYWGCIKDNKNAEFLIRNTRPYDNVPLSEYGYWGFIRDKLSELNENIAKSHQNVSNSTQTTLQLATNNTKELLKSLATKDFHFDDRTYRLRIKALKCRQNKLHKSGSFNETPLNEQVVVACKPEVDKSNLKKLSILHFTMIGDEFDSDDLAEFDFEQLKSVYEVLVCRYEPLRLFCGDVVSNGFLENLGDSFNSLKLHACLYGLNDLDCSRFQQIEKLILNRKGGGTWLVSNLFELKKQHLPLTKCNPMTIVDVSGVKVGILGLMHSNELYLKKNTLKYVDYLSEANRLSGELRQRGADIIVALTQMDGVHDEFLAKNALDIQLIFGGFNREFYVKNVNNRWLVKGGDSLRHLSLMHIYVADEIDEATKRVRKTIADISISKFSV